MGHTVSYAITRPVPAPDRPIVHPQRRKLGYLSARQDLKWILIGLCDHDRTKTRDLIVKQFDDRMSQPFIAKTHARLLTACKLRAGSLVSRMLEERDTSFLPQPVPKQQR